MIHQTKLLTIILIKLAHATITVPSTYGTHKYDSQTARFGMVFEKGKVYEARLQVHEGDPYLCGDDPSWPIAHTYDDIIVPKDDIPVALLAKRGQCSFEAKARRALTLLPLHTIKYVIVYDDKERPTLSIMSAIDSTSNNISSIGLVFISFHSGVDLLVQLMSQPTSIQKSGGYIIHIDSVNPWLPFIKADTQSWLIASLTGIFLIFICFGCIFFFVHVGCLRIESNVIYLRRGGGNDDVIRYTLLTEEQVRNLPQVQYKETSTSTDLKHKTVLVNSYYIGTCCSICLEDFRVGQMLRQLPCKHLFHTNCIIPWLTERQPFCPLCKTQVIVNSRSYNTMSSRSTSTVNDDTLLSESTTEQENDSLITTRSSTSSSSYRQLLQRLRYWTFNYHQWWNVGRRRIENDSNEEERLLLS